MPVPCATSRIGSARESPGTPDRARRHLPGGGRAVAHDHGRRRSGHHAGRHGQPRRGVSATPSPLITLPPLGSGGAAAAHRVVPAGTGRDAGAHRGAQDRPAGHLRVRRLPGLQRRDVSHRRPARPARPGPGDVPLRPCQDGHVPADPGCLEGRERQEDARDDRRGLDQRRPALPVRRHQGQASRPVRHGGRPGHRGRRPSSSGSRRPRVAARSRSSSSSPSRCRRRPPRTTRPTRRRSR